MSDIPRKVMEEEYMQFHISIIFITVTLLLAAPHKTFAESLRPYAKALSTLESVNMELLDNLKRECPRYVAYIGQLEDESGARTALRETMETGKILAMTTLSAIVYGIVMDSITASICIEYFSTGFHYDNLGAMAPALNDALYSAQIPFLYALTWGSIATWWVGLPLGLPLSLAARSPMRSEKSGWVKALPKVGLALGLTLVISLLDGWHYYDTHPDQVDLERRYRTDAVIHQSAYLWGAVFGLGVSGWTWIERGIAAGKIRRERTRFIEIVLDAQLACLGKEAARIEKDLIRSTLC